MKEELALRAWQILSIIDLDIQHPPSKMKEELALELVQILSKIDFDIQHPPSKNERCVGVKSLADFKYN